MKKKYLVLLWAILGTLSIKSQSWVELSESTSLTGTSPSTSATYHTLGYSPSGVNYFLFSDQDKGYKATLIKYNGTTWDTVGMRGFSTYAISEPSIAIVHDTLIYVTFQENSIQTDVTVMKYSAATNTWTYVGVSGFVAASSFYPELILDQGGTLNLIYSDGAQAGKATHKRYTGGTTWNDEAVGFTYDRADNIQVKETSLGEFWLVYRDQSGLVSSYYYDFVNPWDYRLAAYNSVVSAKTYFDLELVFDIPYVALQVGSNIYFQKYDAPNGTWNSFAPIISGSNGYPQLEKDENERPWMSFRNSAAGNKTTTYLLVNSAWTFRGNTEGNSILEFNHVTNKAYVASAYGSTKNHIKEYSCNSYVTLTETRCKPLTSASGNYVYNSTGVYNDTITNNLSCDSIITYDLTFIDAIFDTLQVNACSEYMSPSGKMFNQSGVFNDTLYGDAVTCDTVITINLTLDLDKVTFSNSSPSVCLGNDLTVDVNNTRTGIEYELKNTQGTVLSSQMGNGGQLNFTVTPTTNDTSLYVYGKKADFYTTSSNAFDLNGTISSLKIPNTNNFSLQSNYTIEMWVYPRNGNYDRLLSSWNQSSSAQILFDTYDAVGQNGRALRWVVGSNTNNQIVTSPPNVLTLNTWNHVAVVYSNSTLKMYVDGVMVHSEFNMGLTIPYTASINWTIGDENNNASNTFTPLNGSIDEIRFWNTERTANQITEYMDTCLTGNEQFLKFYLNFEEFNLTNDTIYDLSTSKKHVVGNNIPDLTARLVNGPSIGCTFEGNCEGIVSDTLVVEILDINDSIIKTANGLSAYQAGATYQWLDCSNSYAPLVSETNQTFSPSQAGTYAVEIDNGSCKDTSVCMFICPTPVVNNLPLISGCDSAVYGGVSFYSDTILYDTLTAGASNGCDSIVVTTLAVYQSVDQFNPAIDACDSAFYNGSWYYSSQLVTENYLGVTTNGCDSNVYTQINVTVTDTTYTINGASISANQTAASYQWLDCGNNFAQISGETAATFQASTGGSYAVEITQNNCIDTLSCIQVNTTSLSLTEQKDVRVYPNPATDILNIEGASNEDLVEIYDYIGKRVRVTFAKNIPIDDLQQGVYQLVITQLDKRLTFTFIKE